MLPVLLRVHAVCIGLISSSPHPYSPAPQERAAYVKEFKQCTESNVDDIITLLPDELWGAYMCHRGHRCIDILKLMPACPWGPPVAEWDYFTIKHPSGSIFECKSLEIIAAKNVAAACSDEGTAAGGDGEAE